MNESKNNADFLNIAKEIKALAPHVHPPVPNPAPLGLFAFGLTTALLQMKHTRLTGKSSDDMEGVENLVWGFAIFFGGLLQVIAGLSEIKRNNIFGYTAFLCYGGFWMSLGTTEIVALVGNQKASNINPEAVQAMLVLMGILTFVLWICTFKMNKTICFLIFCLMMTLFLLAAGVNDERMDKVGGWFGIVTAGTAYWLAAAELINDIVGEGEDIIPLGHFSGNKFKFAGVSHVPGRIHGVTHRAVLLESRFGPDESDTNTPTISNKRRSSAAATKEDVESRGESGDTNDMDLEHGDFPLH